MGKIYNIGIIGAGMIAEDHIKNFQRFENVKITSIARKEVSKLDDIKKKYQIPSGTGDYKEILADSNIDFVIITTPPATHKQIFIDSLKAGKHIVLEKPSATNSNDIAEMIKERQKYPELVVCDCSCRHSRLQPKYWFIKNIIDSGKLGDIYFIHHNSAARQGRPGIEYHPAAKWFLNKQIAGGGPSIDWGVYDLSFHLGLLSDKPELQSLDVTFMKSGLDKNDPGTDIYDVEEHFAAMMQFSGGLKYYWERASHANVEVTNETRIYGTKGGLKFAFCSWDSNKVEFFDVENEGKGKARKEIFEVDFSKHESDGYEFAKHFMDVLMNKKKPEMPIERAKKHLEIILKVLEGVK